VTQIRSDGTTDGHRSTRILGEETITADEVIQKLAVGIYDHPLCMVRCEVAFPDLANPLHLAVLLIDCDTEIMMNGMLGYLENMPGRHLAPTIEALRQIGAPAAAGQLQAIYDCMTRFGVTWQRLRGDFDGVQEHLITSFGMIHGAQLGSFTSELESLARGFSLFARRSGEAPYDALCTYLEGRLADLRSEINKRIAQPNIAETDKKHDST